MADDERESDLVVIGGIKALWKKCRVRVNSGDLLGAWRELNRFEEEHNLPISKRPDRFQ